MPSTHWAELAGIALTYAGAAMAIWARFRLADNWSARIAVKVGHQLIRSGPYQHVRHPIYSGAILLALAWALWRSSSLTLAYAFMLLVFFDIKSRREEQWLQMKFPEYVDYQRRVKKLVPFLY